MPGLEQRKRLAQELLLRPDRAIQQLLRERAGAFRVERAAAGARRVQQNLVEREEIIQLARVRLHHHNAPRPLALQVEAEPVRADLVLLAGGDLRAVAGERRHLRGLAAGRRRHVQDALVRPGCQHDGRHHGGQALQVDLAPLVQRQRLHLRLAAGRHHDGVLAPRRRLAGDARGLQHGAHGGGVRPERIDAQRRTAPGGKARFNPLRPCCAVLPDKQLVQKSRYRHHNPLPWPFILRPSYHEKTAKARGQLRLSCF